MPHEILKVLPKTGNILESFGITDYRSVESLSSANSDRSLAGTKLPCVTLYTQLSGDQMPFLNNRHWRILFAAQYTNLLIYAPGEVLQKAGSNILQYFWAIFYNTKGEMLILPCQFQSHCTGRWLYSQSPSANKKGLLRNLFAKADLWCQSNWCMPRKEI